MLYFEVIMLQCEKIAYMRICTNKILGYIIELEAYVVFKEVQGC